MQKKTKNKKLQKVQKENSKALVVQPVHLPVVTTEVPKKKSYGRIFLTIFLLIFMLVIWIYIGFLACDIHNFHKERSPVVPSQLQHKKNVVAVIGNEEISLDEVKAFVSEIPQLAEVPFEQVYPNILEMMINDKVILKGADRLGVLADPYIKKMIKAASDQIIARAYLAKEMEHALTEEDIRSVYEEEIKNFRPEEEIHARHILVPTEKQARDILIQLKAGADFGLLADQKSIDKNAPQGDLGYFTKEMMIPEFSDAVFAMKKGQLSGPIQTVYGWHIVQVEDRRLTQAPALEQVKEQMQQLAMERKVPEIIAAERTRQGVRVIVPTLSSPTEKKEK
ncbi:MAG: peptidyl-prolyl cis-trans isomerase [Alphaproteobacteria bacterium]|nr:peptidyl-prolyl cis-trans isomerase [Alphaproteobacteria bacterium]